jgi:hypothetical protein
MSTVTPRRAETLEARSSRRLLFCLEAIVSLDLCGEATRVWGVGRTARARRRPTWRIWKNVQVKVEWTGSLGDEVVGMWRNQEGVTLGVDGGGRRLSRRPGFEGWLLRLCAHPTGNAGTLDGGWQG